LGDGLFVAAGWELVISFVESSHREEFADVSRSYDDCEADEIEGGVLGEGCSI
jgi:hypothetical protein